MRLTLRTLLAYLDDTLEPAETKAIGQKVAESETAQELIGRIKQVTRRRRLTTPPASGAGGKMFDPNNVAEYLDNELDSEQIAEVEKLCLESDVHLAEIAACHQILTLVLGQPALVPPTAKERMYGLVKGREAIPYRKAPQPARTAAGASNDADDSLMPFGRMGTAWTIWGGALAGLCLLVVLGIALYRTVSAPGNDPGRHLASTSKGGDKTGGKDGAEAEKELPAAPDNAKGKVEAKDKEKTPEKAATSEPDKPPAAVPAGDGKPLERGAPSPDRRELATYIFTPRAQPSPSVLVARAKDSQSWRRVTPGSHIASTDPLVSLPGCPSELRLDSGVRLQLWGSLPEFALLSAEQVKQGYDWVLLESAITLHAPRGQDADFTLERGRVYISNNKEKGPALVRVRFDREIWDLVLQEPGTEVAIDFIKKYTSDIDFQHGEEPRAEFYLCVLQGKAGLKTDMYQEYPNLSAPPGPAMFAWNNKGAAAPGPLRLETPLAVWGRDLPVNENANEMRLAVKEISERMIDKKAVDVALQEGLQGPKLSHHTLSLLSLGAIDAVPTLLDILADEDPTHGHDRNVAIYALRRWISRGADISKRLFDPKTGSGILIDKKYSRGDSKIILELLYPMNAKNLEQAETYQLLAGYLKRDKIALRELAYWHFARMSFPVWNPTKFNPAMPAEQREAVTNEMLKMIKDGKLPPATQRTPPRPASL